MESKGMATSILDMINGAIKERVDYDVARVVENILDANTDPKAKRKITLTIELCPSADRTHITVHTGSKATLAPVTPVETTLGMMPDDNGEMQLVELLPQVAGQMDMEGGEARAPKVLKLAALADQRKTM